MFGSCKRNDTKPSHFCRSAGSISRKSLQSLEGLTLIEKSPDGGRKMTQQGRRDLDRIAAQLLPIHGDLTDAGLQRRKSRPPPTLLAEKLVGENYDLNDEWRKRWETPKASQAAYIADPTVPLPGMELPRHQCKTLNRIRMSHGICRDSFYKWGLAETPTSESPARLSTT
ncbi:unnamed protein product [Callosobruchus maculatus]|uniref:Uncharacterized protein n=1 Tax=Callosobruchus maculatus TaxID=64391 RepID=A0A653BU97_CALMS|nr:unnamed protein product [Callosobruchus maculatus]